MVYSFCDFCELRVLLLFFASVFHNMFCFVYFFLYTLYPDLPVICTHIITAAQICVVSLSTQLYFLLIRENILGLHQFLIVNYN